MIKALNYRAGTFGYLVLAGPWLLMAIGSYQEINYLKGYTFAAIICLSVTVLWSVWLLGFHIRITEYELRYRNGYYRTTTVPRSDIISAKHGTEKVPLRFGGTMQFSALVVKYKVGNVNKVLYINPLPFGGNIKTVIGILNDQQVSEAADR